MNYYNINTALFNYVSLRASSTVAFHPTVKTVGFPGLHFVTQTWLVDEDGDFIETKSDCDEVTHAPDAEDLFTCSKCGAEVPAKYAYSE